jgi:uncharacterized protein YxeA
MKKINIILTVLLIIAVSFVYNNVQELNALKDTQTQLTQETVSMKNELDETKQNCDAKETELAKITEENSDKLEELEVWQKRTAELQALQND